MVRNLTKADLAQGGFLTRLRAWWDGYVVPDSPAGARAGKARRYPVIEDGGKEPHFEPGQSLLWTPERVTLAELVWGKAFIRPGGPEHVSHLIKPFVLNQEKSVLEVGAALGGATRLLARETGAWVTGVESDQVLERAGMRYSLTSNMDKKAPVVSFDPDKPVFDKNYDAVFAQNVFYSYYRKDAVFDAIRDHMKSRGQFSFTDYVYRHSASLSRTTEDWRRDEAVRPYPWSVGQITSYLQEAKFDIRIVEDITPQHCSQIVHAWEHLAESLPEVEDYREAGAKLIEEGEVWQRRVKALDTGDLAVFRFFAIYNG